MLNKKLLSINDAFDPSVPKISFRQFVVLSERKKVKCIENEFNEMRPITFAKDIMWILYAISSLIAFISPIAWIIWVWIKYSLYDFIECIFTSCVTSC